MNTKENLVNKLVIQLAENTNLSIGELKAQIETTLYSYSVDEIKSTEITCNNGETTQFLLDYFKIGKLSSNKSEQTIVQYATVAMQLCNFVRKELNMITAEDIRYFLVKYQREHNISFHTMESKRLYLSSIFTYLHKNNKIAENPMLTIDPIKYTKKVKQPITQEEFERIIIACEDDKRMIAVIYLLIDTGVRISELCGIKLKDVDFVNRKILILGKGSKERYVYFDGRTKVRLIDYINSCRKDISYINGEMVYGIDTPLIASQVDGYHSIGRSQIAKYIRNIGKKTGILRIHPHLFRATFATNMLLSGKDLVTVSKLMGHSKLDTTKEYILLSDKQIELSVKSA